MATLKTQQTMDDVATFLASVASEEIRKDCRTLIGMMEAATGGKAAMWGGSMVGFGNYHYVYDSGREGNWFLTGFSPRKQNLTLYIMSGFERYNALLDHLGKYKTGKSCLYVKSLSDIDLKVLETLICESVGYMRERYK